jgi:hypothetical protein
MNTVTAEPMVTPEVKTAKRKGTRDKALAVLAAAAKITPAEAEAAVASTIHTMKPTQAEIDEAVVKTAKRLANLRPVIEAGIAKPAPKLAAAIKKAVKQTPKTTAKPEAAPAATGSVVWINGPERQKDGSMVGDYRLRLPGGFEDATGQGFATKADAMKAAADLSLTIRLRKDVGPSGQSLTNGAIAEAKPAKAIPKVKALAAEREAFGIKPFAKLHAANSATV